MVFVGLQFSSEFASCVGAAQSRASQGVSAGEYVMVFVGLRLAPEFASCVGVAEIVRSRATQQEGI